MIECFDSDRDSVSEMNVLRAIRWGISVWEHHVKISTIQNCWARAQAYDWGARGLTQRPILGNEWAESESTVQEIARQIQSMRDSGQISEAMAIKNFINPSEEDVRDTDEDLIDQIVAEFGPEPPEDSEEKITEIPSVKLSEALQGLAKLKLYEEQQAGPNMNPELTSTLRKHERKLTERHRASLQQKDLRGWMGAK